MPNTGAYDRRYRVLRAAILAESDFCWLCGHYGSAEIDHVIPLSQGGSATDPDNMRPSHGTSCPCPVCGRKCNQAKSAKTIIDFKKPKTSRDWYKR